MSVHAGENGLGRDNVRASAVHRIDDPPGRLDRDATGPRHSGKAFVLAASFVLGALALALFVAFRQWKDKHQELAEFGARHVATAVVELKSRTPPGVTPAEWALLVEQTRRMLEGLTGTGVLDLEQMRQLRTEIQLRLDSQSDPRFAAFHLAMIWQDAESRAGPALTRHPRFELACLVRTLTNVKPPEAGDSAWCLAVVRARAMLVALAYSKALSKADRESLRDALLARCESVTRASAWNDLLGVWTLVSGARPLPAGFTTPEPPASD